MESGSSPSVKEYLSGRCACTWTRNSAGFRRRQIEAAVGFRRKLWSAFVPEGHLPCDYYEFQGAAATAGSAFAAFFMRDVSGMLGGVLFAAIQGGGMDPYAKQWRLFADCFNNVGYVLELLSPVIPGAFLYLACLGSIARAVTGVAAGATRSALTYHFAQEGNPADIAAKEGSQETAVTLLGMALGFVCVRLAADSWRAVWTLFLCLTALHIFSNVKAMRALRLTSLNRPRLDAILSHYSAHQEVPSVEEVAQQESLLAPPVAACLDWLLYRVWRSKRHTRRPQIILGATFSDLAPLGQAAVVSHGKKAAYVLWSNSFLGPILVLLAPGASKRQVLKAYVDAWVEARTPPRASHGVTNVRAMGRLLRKEDWASFVAALKEQGWDLGSIALGETQWRVAWSDHLHAE